jgi:hypothetical protein
VFMLVGGILFTVIMAVLSRYTGVPSLAAGVLIAWLAFGFYLFSPAAFDLGNPLMIEFSAWSFLGGACGLAITTFVTEPGRKILLLSIAAIPVIFMFTPMIVLSMIKPEDGAMVSVLLLIYAMGLLLPQVMLIFGKMEEPVLSKPALANTEV